MTSSTSPEMAGLRCYLLAARKLSMNQRQDHDGEMLRCLPIAGRWRSKRKGPGVKPKHKQTNKQQTYTITWHQLGILAPLAPETSAAVRSLFLSFFLSFCRNNTACSVHLDRGGQESPSIKGRASTRHGRRQRRAAAAENPSKKRRRGWVGKGEQAQRDRSPMLTPRGPAGSIGKGGLRLALHHHHRHRLLSHPERLRSPTHQRQAIRSSSDPAPARAIHRSREFRFTICVCMYILSSRARSSKTDRQTDMLSSIQDPLRDPHPSPFLYFISLFFFLVVLSPRPSASLHLSVSRP